MFETVQVGKKVHVIRWRHPNKMAWQNRRRSKSRGRYHFSRTILKEGSEVWVSLFGGRTRPQVVKLFFRLSRMKKYQQVFLSPLEYRALNEHRAKLGKERLVRYMCIPRRRGGRKTGSNFLLLKESHRSFMQAMLQGATLEEFARHLDSLEAAAVLQSS